MRSTLNFKKGLLSKSFFVLILVSGFAHGKTLIFQSNESTSTGTQGSPVGQQAGASVAASQSVQSVSSQSNVNSELFFMVEQLKQEVMSLRGLVEEQSFQLRQMQERSLDRYRDVDERLQALSQQATAVQTRPVQSAVPAPVVPIAPQAEVVPVSQESAASSTPETDEQKVAYQQAYNLVMEKNFPEAIDALHGYVEKYPEGDLTGNAFYWLGEVYLVLPKLEQAKQAFSIVVKTFPSHRKLADAMYKLAVAHDRLQEPAEAERYLKRVQEEYPDSTAARLAANYTVSR